MPLILSSAHKVLQLQPVVEQYANGSFYVYTGAQPLNPRLAPIGTLLGTVTRDSQQYQLGNGSNGVSFVLSGGGFCTQAQAWFLNGIADGIAGWVRWITRNDTLLDDMTLPRADFGVNDPGVGLVIGDPAITAGSRRSVTYALYGIPPFD